MVWWNVQPEPEPQVQFRLNPGLPGSEPDHGQSKHWHAISGYVFLVDRGAVSWSSKKQEIITLSTAKSEYITAMYAAVKILTPSLVHSRVMGLLFVILLLYLVTTTIIPLTFQYQPLSVPFWSVCSLVLSINIITLGSSGINYDFILTSYYPSNGCFPRKLSIPDYYIVISYFIILYMFHFYLGI